MLMISQLARHTLCFNINSTHAVQLIFSLVAIRLLSLYAPCSNTGFSSKQALQKVTCVCNSFDTQRMSTKGSRKAKNRYNQVPHRPRTTHRKVTKHKKTSHTREPRGQPPPPPTGDHKTATNRQESTTNTKYE